MNLTQKILASLAMAASVTGCAIRPYNVADVAREHTGNEIYMNSQETIDSVIADQQITPSEINKLGTQYLLIKAALQNSQGLDEKDENGISVKDKLEAQQNLIKEHMDNYLISAGDTIFVDVIMQYNKQDNMKVARGTDAPFNFETNRTQGMNATQLEALCQKLGVDKYELAARMTANFQRNTGSHSQLYNTATPVNKTNFEKIPGLTLELGDLVNDTKRYDVARLTQLWNNQANDDEFDTVWLKARTNNVYKFE